MTQHSVQAGSKKGAPTKVGPAWFGRAALAFVVVALGVAAYQASKLVRGWLLPSPTAFVQAESGNDERLKQRETQLEESIARLDGRSIFYVPSKPGEVVAAPTSETEESEEVDEVVPAKYEGPAIAAIALDEVWFAGGKRARAGGDAVEGVRVISTNAPWGARLEWRGKEFDVAFFERDRVVFKGR